MRPENTRTERKFMWDMGNGSEVIFARWSVISYMAFGMLTIIIGSFVFRLDSIAIPLSAFFVLAYFISGKIVIYSDKIFIPVTLLSGRLISFNRIDKIIVEYTQRYDNTLPSPSSILILHKRQINYLDLNNFFMDNGCRDFIKLLKEKTSKNSIEIIDIENIDNETRKKLKDWKEEHHLLSPMRIFLSCLSLIVGFLVGVLPATDIEYFNVLDIVVFGNTHLPPLISLTLLVFSLLIWISRENFLVDFGVRNMLILSYSEIESDDD